jgi:hypothetical protein
VFCYSAAEWYGWAAGVLGTAGALMLVRPLFILLRQREALETLVYALDARLAPDDLKLKVQAAREEFARSVFAGRKRWKAWAYAGLGFLAAAIAPLVLQFGCLIR